MHNEERRICYESEHVNCSQIKMLDLFCFLIDRRDYQRENIIYAKLIYAKCLLSHTNKCKATFILWQGGLKLAPGAATLHKCCSEKNR